MKCKWKDGGLCTHAGSAPTNIIGSHCGGTNNCYAYGEWMRDQDMLDTTTPAEAMQEIAHIKAVERKQRPVYSGVLKYFPDAIMEVAHCSWLGQQQHNPDLPLAWDREKSGDELDALVRHLMQADEMDEDGVLHAAKVAWRALAYLQKLLETNKKETA